VRILLTGTTGQVGGARCAPLAELGEVIPVDRTQLDLSRPETIAGLLDLIRPDLVVNPAAYTPVDRAEDERSLLFASMRRHLGCSRYGPLDTMFL
jgi:dTDP-4-dehydrorhamnose reductase